MLNDLCVVGPVRTPEEKRSRSSCLRFLGQREMGNEDLQKVTQPTQVVNTNAPNLPYNAGRLMLSAKSIKYSWSVGIDSGTILMFASTAREREVKKRKTPQR
jgi:hypothetical protein